jgi:diguanylate cyclase (GGDEF)-like protein
MRPFVGTIQEVRSMIRLLICDDSAEARAAVRALLVGQGRFEVVGEAANGEQAVTLAVALWPDVVLMDVSMPVLDGVEATRRIRRLLPEIRIVGYSGAGDEETVTAMIEAGATGYYRKGAPVAELERVVANPADPLVRLAHRLAYGVTGGGTAALVARELAELSCASFAATYLTAHEGLSLAGVAGPAAVEGLASAPELAYRAVAEGTWLRAEPQELAELFRLGIPCSEALAAPLVAHGEALGALVVGLPMNVQFSSDPEFLTAVADLAAASVAVERTLALTVAEARSDALTGLGNRRAFDEHLARLIARVHAEGGEVSLVLVDLDDFKEINDREGHPAGDRVLRAVARTLVRAVRANEEVFRVGGDEFAVVVDGGAEAAARVADRIAGMLLGQRRINPLPTVSAGIATLPATAATADELVRRADLALYRTKRAGKNDVLHYERRRARRREEDQLLQPAPPRRARPGTALRLLFVDDDPGLRILLRTTFEIVGIELAEAGSAGAATERIVADRPDVIVLDASLPDRDGLSFCRSLKADPSTREIGVVLLTGAVDVDAETARVAGADAFLRKPFSPLDLLAVVDEVAGGIYEGPFERGAERPPEEQLLVYAHDLRRLLELEMGQRERLETAYRSTVTALAGALEWKDLGTGAHSQRVQRYACALARAVDPALLADPSVEYGFLLHDVGKIGIPDRILLKEGPLDRPERRLIETHPLLGERLLTDVALVQGAGLRVVRSHHERWDGKGYPDRLRGREIPLGARVFAVADALDAITSQRPYRAAGSWGDAVAEIVSGRGRQFDPDVVEAFRTEQGVLRQVFRELAGRDD